MGQKGLGQMPAKLNLSPFFPLMNTEQQFFIGIDVSKLWFDASLLVRTNHQRGPIHSSRFDNTAAGLKIFAGWLKGYGIATDSEVLMVMENTGIYHRLLWQWCTTNGIAVHIGNGAHIRWSLGITRGKSDKADSVRLCNYALKEAEALKAAPALNPVLLKLKDLWTSRSRLLTQLNANRTYLRELKNISDSATQKTLEGAYKAAVEGLAKSLATIGAEIKTVVAQNEDLRVNYELLLSVPGVGHLTAVYLLCCTANFCSAPSGKQLACYAGLAPFGHSSGTSVKGRPRVHKMANKELKRLLYMGARAAIQHDAEMKAYYERKKQEGKHDLSIVNAIKNKMVLRVAAVVRNRRPYVAGTLMAA